MKCSYGLYSSGVINEQVFDGISNTRLLPHTQYLESRFLRRRCLLLLFGPVPGDPGPRGLGGGPRGLGGGPRGLGGGGGGLKLSQETIFASG